MSLTMYGLNKCSTCLKARAWLTEHQVAHVFVDYRDHPVPAATLAAWAQQLGGWEKLINRASPTWRNLPESLKSPADSSQWIALIAQYPTLVRRPVTADATGKISIGFSAARYAECYA